MEMRDYQVACDQGIWDQWSNGSHSTLVSMATGLGKTVVMGHVAKRSRGRVMLMAHRDELIRQGADKFARITGEPVDIEMADEVADTGGRARRKTIVSSVQTMNARRGPQRRMERFNPMDFEVLMIDEAHHATAQSYRRVIDFFRNWNPKINLLGVTATPDRTDEEALGQIFKTVAYEYGIVEGIDDGWLVPIEQQFVHVEGLDMSGCKPGKDFQDNEISQIMQQEKILHGVVGPTIEMAMHQPTLVFASSVAQAEGLAEVFNRHQEGSAYCIHGKTDRRERRERLEAFARGEFQFLCNMGVFLEGFDQPSISVIIQARPTKSRSLYAQIIGRGTRPLPGVVEGVDRPEDRRRLIGSSGKPGVLVLDLVGNSGRHKLISTADILGGNESDDVVSLATERAKKKGLEGEKVNMSQELLDARLELEEQAKQKRRRLIAKTNYRSKVVNPFDIFDVMPRREPGWHKGRKPTPKMKAALERFKVDKATINNLTFCQASQMMDMLIKRIENNYCTVKQAAILARFGEDVNVSFKDASAKIDQIAQNRWMPLT